MKKYLGIVFPETINCSFSDFCKIYEPKEVFKNIPSDKRKQSLKEAYKIAVPNAGNNRATKESSGIKARES
ncbi:hypothetical protein [Tenacibaculum sp. 190524A02b]|uniref:hypothetical protein n=1 Tax=Tenacibaculum vairaonense TaxID=3137860 RepID=UPI0032B1E44E